MAEPGPELTLLISDLVVLLVPRLSSYMRAGGTLPCVPGRGMDLMRGLLRNTFGPERNVGVLERVSKHKPSQVGP